MSWNENYNQYPICVAKTQYSISDKPELGTTPSDYILDVNMKYLQHDYFTDIITFDYCEKDFLNGDLFISIDSVRENALYYGTEFADELNRVMVHGLLHLIGYDDHSEEDIKMMRYKENYYLELRKAMENDGK